MTAPSGGDWVVVAVGANLEDPEGRIRRAVAYMRAWAALDFRTSSLWSSTPQECPPGTPRFVNAVVGFRIQAGWAPETLLDALQQLERDLGRAPKRVHNEARALDLDLVAFGEETRVSARLTLPHPRAVFRRFVMEPLAEILPDFRAPGWAGTAQECLAKVVPDPEFSRIGPMAVPS